MRRRRKGAVGRPTATGPEHPRTAGAGHGPHVNSPLANAAASLVPTVPAPAAIDDVLRVEEVPHAAFYVGDLFRRHFGGAVPDFPRHFVALYRSAVNAFVTLGYVHCTVDGDLCLCGGLVEDRRAIGRMPAPHQHALRAGASVTRRLLSAMIGALPDKPAFWAYVGEGSVRDTFVSAGFETLPVPNLLVRWSASVPASAKPSLVARVVALGPF